MGLILYNRFLVGRSFDEGPVARVDVDAFPTVFVGALPALSIPVIIRGGIYGGIFTPTEAAGVAVVAALIVGGLIYREFTLLFARLMKVGEWPKAPIWGLHGSGRFLRQFGTIQQQRVRQR
jgi:TRAP-type C4-dicarboxylate transport system permease large subunit